MKISNLSRKLIVELIVLFLLVAATVYKVVNVYNYGGYPTPRTAQDHFRLTGYFLESAEYLKAEKAARKVISIDSTFAKSYIDLGIIYSCTGDYIKAEKPLLEALKYIGNDDENEALTYFNLGCIYDRERKAKKSWGYYRKAYEIKKDSKEFKLQGSKKRTLVYYVVRNDKRKFIKEVKGDKGIPAELLKRKEGLSRALSSKRYKDVINDCMKYQKENPGSVYSYIFTELYASALSGQGKYKESMNVLASLGLLSLPRQNIAFKKHLNALNLFHLGEYDRAWEISHDIVKAYPDYEKMGNVDTLIGNIIKKNHGKVSLEDLAARGLPESHISKVKEKMAYALYSEGSYDEALVYLNEILDNHLSYSRYGNVLYEKADVYKKMYDIKNEKETLELYMKTYPGNTHRRSIRWRLGEIYVRQGEYIRGFDAFILSGLSFLMMISSIFFSAVLSGIFIGVFALFCKIFFRKKLFLGEEKRIFRRSDIFVFITLLFCVPWILTIFVVNPIYYNYSHLFEKIGLNPMILGHFLGQVSTAVICLLLLKRKYKLSNPMLGYMSRGFKVNVLLPFGVTFFTLGVAFTFWAILYMLKVKVPPSQVRELAVLIAEEGKSIQKYYFLAVSSIVVPICEETVFRVFMLNFLKKYTNIPVAIIFSALLFAFVHQAPVLFPYFAIIGIILGVMYVKTKTIIPCIVTHALYNFSILFLVLGKY